VTEPTVPAALTWRRVVETVLGARDLAPVVALFKGRDEAERRALRPEFEAAVRQAREGGAGVPLGELRHVGVACLGGPAAIARWIARRDFETEWDSNDDRDGDGVPELLADRDPEWIGDVAARLVAKLPARPWDGLWTVVDALVRASGMPLPDSAGYVWGWAVHTTRAHRLTEGTLATDPRAGELVPRLFDVEGIGNLFEGERTWTYPGRVGWAGALAELAEAGVVERAVLLDGCVSRLLSGERLGARKAFVEVHDTLRPTEVESAERADSYIRMLTGVPSPVASWAQGVLRRLDEAGRLTTDQLAATTRAVLPRPERKPARTRLT
jgi:hypothetical protein